MNKGDRMLKRQKRTRAKIHGTQNRPRLSVFRSNNYIYAQLIDDDKMQTILGVSEQKLGKKEGSKVEMAKKLGLLLAKQATSKKINKVIFDRGGYMYKGRVEALARGAREGGLDF
jgi:large subunit ribosomal protein L18